MSPFSDFTLTKEWHLISIQRKQSTAIIRHLKFNYTSKHTLILLHIENYEVSMTY